MADAKVFWVAKNGHKFVGVPFLIEGDKTLVILDAKFAAGAPPHSYVVAVPTDALKPLKPESVD